MSNNISVKDAGGSSQTLRTIDNGTYHVPQHGRAAQPAAMGNVNQPASNTAAVVTKAAAGAGISNLLAGVYWSYDGAPTGGSLKIEDGGGNVVFIVSVTAAGPGSMLFNPPLKGTANTALIATLAAGGGGVTGKVNVHSWTEG